MAQAARVPLNRVFYDDVPKNGTSTPAGLFSLKNYSMQYELTPGDLFMLLSGLLMSSVFRFSAL